MKNKLLKRSNGGFSLVELIVVIAIMAILVGVAVPVYSSYIEKSQKAKDEQMIDEIKHAIEIAAVGDSWYQTVPGGGAVGTIVLKNGANAVVNGQLLIDALTDTFGTDYASKLQLSYDGWTGNLNADAAYLLLSSGYVSNAGSPAEGVSDLLGTVQDVTTLFAGVVGNLDDYGVTADMTYFKSLFGLSGTEPTQQQIANGMVVYIAEQQKNIDPNVILQGWTKATPDFAACATYTVTDESGNEISETDAFAQKAVEYAYVQALVSRTGCATLKAKFDGYNTTFQGASPYQNVWVAHKAECTSCNAFVYDAQMGTSDALAYCMMMNQVSESKDMVVQNSNSATMYTNSPLTQYVGSYVTVAELLDQTSAIAQDGDVVIVVSLDAKGVISTSVYPLEY